MFRISLKALLAVCLVLVGQQVQAAMVMSLIKPGPNKASDEDREFLIDNDFLKPLAPGFGIKGQIDVGDSFRGHINFNTLNSGSANLGGTTPNNELTGVFQVMVTSKVALGGGFFSFTFGADPTFVEGAGTLGGAPVIVLWESALHNYAGDFNDPPPAGAPPADTDSDPTLPFDDGTLPPRTVPPSSADVSTGPYLTEESFITTAKDGTRFITIGFAGAPGEGFTALSTSGDNVLTFFSIASGTSGATNNFSLSRLDGLGPETADSITFGPTPGAFGPIVGFAGSQQLRGVADLDTSFEISTNTNVSFNVLSIVPEPTSCLLWLGMAGVFGIGGTLRRRRTAANS